LYIDKIGKYHSEPARNMYNKSKRVYAVYKCFPNALVQIYGAKNISGDKLIKIGNEQGFNKFIMKIEEEVNKFRDLYNYKSDSLSQFEQNFKYITVTQEVLNEVLKYVRYPSTCTFDIDPTSRVSKSISLHECSTPIFLI
jgi:hypothetical protein